LSDAPRDKKVPKNKGKRIEQKQDLTKQTFLEVAIPLERTNYWSKEKKEIWI